ncbi:MAG: hypothetical protein J7604_00940 [Sporocytophaga sp.]|uniref:hypothetical protein n=1 Tax=Sporocytophaga sp. TaxID=2231183 RepID=UPI001B0AC828|nr:hypothetical protein [Sporocytophaga sp.]MBO9698737.1 hypothetical protein [Sporocytophaga sp.]
MTVDLIQRVIRLREMGEPSPYHRFIEWLDKSAMVIEGSFIANNDDYYWTRVNSMEFEDIILEDSYDWLYIFNSKKSVKLVGKIVFYRDTYDYKKDYPIINTFWILESEFPGITLNDRPINVRSPHFIVSPFHRIEFDLKKLIEQFENPKVVIIEYVDYKIDKSGEKYIRKN